MDDSIASSIWKQLDKFGSEVKELFEDQFYLINCIPIGLDGYTTQVYQLHTYTKIHISNFTLMCLTWTLHLYHGLQKEILMRDVLPCFNIA
jgi:hypothetical protein